MDCCFFMTVRSLVPWDRRSDRSCHLRTRRDCLGSLPRTHWPRRPPQDVDLLRHRHGARIGRRHVRQFSDAASRIRIPQHLYHVCRSVIDPVDHTRTRKDSTLLNAQLRPMCMPRPHNPAWSKDHSRPRSRKTPAYSSEVKSVSSWASVQCSTPEACATR